MMQKKFSGENWKLWHGFTFWGWVTIFLTFGLALRWLKAKWWLKVKLVSEGTHVMLGYFDEFVESGTWVTYDIVGSMSRNVGGWKLPGARIYTTVLSLFYNLGDVIFETADGVKLKLGSIER